MAPKALGTRRVPLYVKKARLYLQRQRAYEQTMEARMEALGQTTAAFAGQLYLRHVTGRRGNVLLSPLSAYASLAMTLTASRGVTKREVLTALGLKGEGRGIHSSLQRALTSLRDDDTDDVNDNIGDGDIINGGGGEGEETAGRLDLSQKDLADIVRNDYIIDSSISYNTGQTQIRYSSVGVQTGQDGGKPPADSAPEPDPGMFIRLAHGMFHGEEVALSQHFSNRLVSLYGAPPMAMQQQQQQGGPETSVNLWVDAASRGAVPAVLAAGSVSRETLLLLVGAFAFRGAWQTNFDEKETLSLEFQTGDGDSMRAQCMYRAGNYSVKTLEGEAGAKVLELPYANPRYSLFVFLPRSPGGLRALERGLKTPRSVQDLLRDMPEPAVTIVMLPKFRLLSRVSLDSELQLMGVRKLFRKGKADLRRMTDEEKSVLFVDDFVQYAEFQVDEGTKRDWEKAGVELGSDRGDHLQSGASDQRRSNSSDPVRVIGDDDDDDDDDDGGSDQGHLQSGFNVERSNSSDPVRLIGDDDDDAMIEDDDYMNDEYDYDEDYEEYDYDSDDESGDSSTYFIADKPFFFVVMDKQYDLILLMGRMTNPLP